MTQMDTLLTAKAQPSPTLHGKPDTDAQSDEAAQFVEVWSVQADKAVANNAAKFLTCDAFSDPDVAKAAIATPPENTQTPVPRRHSKKDVRPLQVTGPATPEMGTVAVPIKTIESIIMPNPALADASNIEVSGVQNHAALKAAPENVVQQAQTRHRNPQPPLPQTDPHVARSSREGGSKTTEKPTEPEQIKATPPNIPQLSLAGTSQVTSPQLLNLQRALPPVDEKTQVATPKPRQNAPQTLWSVAAPSPRDPIAKPIPSPIPIAPILAKLATLDPAILADEALGPDLGAPPVTQSSVTTTAAAASTLPRTYAPHVAHQIATAIVQTSGATTEIALNPEELGRVRISVTAGDTGLTVAIIAERPETVDLMRRNIDLLTRELREMGYENPTFTFSDQSGDADQDRGDGAEQLGVASDPSTADEHPQTSICVALSGGLDLKL
jgi:flagellar hook-length control protein FliK